MPASATINLVANDRRFGPAMKRVQRVMGAVQARMKAVARSARNILLVGGTALIGFIKLAADQEAAEKGLDEALKATGQSVEVFSQKLRDAATELQRITITGDEVTLVLFTMATNLGVNADKLDETIRLSLGLAKALKQDVNSALRNVILALNGEFTMLSRYIPAIRSATTENEKLAAVLGIAEAGFVQVQAEIKTTTGRLIQLKNSMGDLGEALGFLVLPGLEKMTEAIKKNTQKVQDWVKANGALILTIVKWSAVTLGLLVVLPKLIAGVKALIVVMGALKIAMFFLIANPLALKILLVVAAIGGITVGVVELISRLKEADKEFEDFNKTGQEQIDILAEGMKKLGVNMDEPIEKLSTMGIETDKLTKAQKKANTALRTWIENLKLQIDTLGMSSNAVKLEKFRRDEVSEALLNQAQAHTELLEAQKQERVEGEKLLAQQSEIQELAGDRIKTLTREIALRLKLVTQSQLELMDLKQAGVGGISRALIGGLLKIRDAFGEGKGTQSSFAEVVGRSIAGRFESLTGLFRRVQEAAAGKGIEQKQLTAANKSAVANQKAATLLADILAGLRLLTTNNPVDLIARFAGN